MGLNRRAATGVTKVESTESIWENLKPGDYDGRLVYVADLGLQTKDYKGEFKGNFQQISLGIEIIGESVTTEEGGVHPKIMWVKPFYIYKEMGAKSKEFEYYSLFEPDAEPETCPDWEAQLGKPISVSVTNIQGKGENSNKTYDNIKSLTRIPERYQGDVGEAVAEVGVGNSDDPNNAVTKALFGLPKYVYEHRVLDDNSSPAVKNVDMEPALDDGAPY